jgi:anaerobic selenocysteine-containing dehydrogenase
MQRSVAQEFFKLGKAIPITKNLNCRQYRYGNNMPGTPQSHPHMFEKWSSPEAVFQILKEVSRDQPCDITGIRDYRMIDEAGGIQWPLPEASTHASAVDDASQRSPAFFEQERRLFEDGLFYHSDKKARFLFEAPRDVPEPTDSGYPFVLLTGRGTSSQWHTQTRTGKSAVLKKLYPDHIYVEMNPLDAEPLGIEAS